MLAPLSTTQSLTGLDRHHLAWLRGIYYVESDKHTLQISREENEPEIPLTLYQWNKFSVSVRGDVILYRTGHQTHPGVARA